MGKSMYKTEELVEMAMQLAKDYAGLESSSVTYEKASQMMEAVQYCIQTYEKEDEIKNGELNDMARALPIQVEGKLSAKEAYYIGFDLLREEVEKLRILYNHTMERFDDYGNRCLRDTVKDGIPEFLKWYDLKYAPQETILTLDYPLLVANEECGVHAVYRYMKGIQLEQIFLSELDKAFIVDILDRYNADYRNMVDNITEPVIHDVLKHLLIKKDITSDFTDYDYQKLKRIISQNTNAELMRILDGILTGFTTMYYKDVSKQLGSYFRPALLNLVSRMKNAVKYDCLETIC